MSDILFERLGAAGVITLNRPKALNALTHPMIRDLARQLANWAGDDAITRVILRAEGERAFCAGGDIRALYHQGRDGKQEDARAFFREEYALNAAIKRYRKPYISLIDGIVMGGGVGISSHGSHRVAGDKYVFAMPEVGIGFFPDVGTTWVLPRLPGELGTYCALTGERLNADDGVASGAATHRVQSARLTELAEALCGDVPVDAILGAFSESAGTGPAVQRREAIDRLFAADQVEAILARLDEEAAGGSSHSEWARQTVETMRTKSPTSMKIAIEQMRRGREASFEDCMRMEFRIVSRVVYGRDLYEGVRALLIDKDNAPRWRPHSLDAVSESDVARYFAPLEDAELAL